MRAWAFSGTVAAMLAAQALSASSASAEGSAQERAAAQVLFDQGKDLIKAGKIAEACPKFEESQRLDPRIATQFKLADCYEQIGRTASAWTNFLDVAATTKAAGQADREKVARERAASLERKLSRLTIMVPSNARAPGLRVQRDGVAVGEPLWGTAVPVDPGEHRIAAVATGKKGWETAVMVQGKASSVSVSVPVLEDDPGASAPATFGEPSSSSSSSSSGGAMSGPSGADRPVESSGTGQRVLGAVLGGVGVAGAVVGTVFGLQAKSKRDEAKTHCRTEQFCSETGLALTSDAKSAATVSTIAFIAGGAALTAGVVLFITAPSSPEKANAGRVRAVPLLGPQTAGAAMMGVW